MRKYIDKENIKQTIIRRAQEDPILSKPEVLDAFCRLITNTINEEHEYDLPTTKEGKWSFNGLTVDESDRLCYSLACPFCDNRLKLLYGTTRFPRYCNNCGNRVVGGLKK